MMVSDCVQIDTGIDLQHPDIQANLWMNPKEMAGPGATAANGYQNGIDDDGNGGYLLSLILAWGLRMASSADWRSKGLRLCCLLRPDSQHAGSLW